MPKARIVSVCVACAFLISPVSAQSPEKRPQQAQHQQSPAANNSGPTQPAFPLVVVNVPAEAVGSSPKKDNGPRPAETSSKWLGIPSDGWVAVFTGLLFISTSGLWWATLTAIKHARKSSEIELRAYVFAGGFDLKHLKEERDLESLVTFKNSGKTPASGLETCVHTMVEDFPLIRPLPDLQWPGRSSTLGPDQETYVPDFMRQPTAADWADIERNRKSIYLYGECRYRDAFGHKRYARFRLHSRHDEGGMLRMMRHPEGNAYG